MAYSFSLLFCFFSCNDLWGDSFFVVLIHWGKRVGSFWRQGNYFANGLENLRFYSLINSGKVCLVLKAKAGNHQSHFIAFQVQSLFIFWWTNKTNILPVKAICSYLWTLRYPKLNDWRVEIRWKKCQNRYRVSFWKILYDKL